MTGLQHAGTAATALVAALAYVKDRGTRNNNMQYLECLAAALQDMAHTYVPAEKMSNVLGAVIVELRDAVPEARAKPPRRRRSSNHENGPKGPFKRHQSFHHDDRREVGSEHPQNENHPSFMGNGQSHMKRDQTFHAQPSQAPKQTQSSTQVHAPQAPSSDEWTMVGATSGNGWSNMQRNHTGFDQTVLEQNQQATQPNPTNPEDVAGQVDMSGSGTQNVNFTQYRSNNAWMGAETPIMGFSTPPLTTPFPNTQSQRSNYRSGLHEIQDLTFPDFVGLLNPDDRLDFGNLGLPTSIGTGFGNIGMDPVHNDMEIDNAGSNDNSRLFDTNAPALPTPSKTPTNMGSELQRHYSNNATSTNTGTSYAPMASSFSRSRSQSEVDSRTFSRTMAGLADILRRGTEGGR